MKTIVKIISIALVVFVISGVFCACSSGGLTQNDDTPIIKVGGTNLEKEYIGYFFYVAQLNMIKEAGMVLGEGGNSTQKDVDSFWKTTEIEGKKAQDVARDLAADNAVMQTVQYLKAVDEGIVLDNNDENEVESNISAAIESSGGKDKFIEQLKSKGFNEESYRQILIENVYINKLYEKYASEGKISVSQNEIESYIENNPELSQEDALDRVKKEKFNQMSRDWEKDYKVTISDEKMKEFKVK